MHKSLFAMATCGVLIGAWTVAGCMDLTPITDVPARDSGLDIVPSSSSSLTTCTQCCAGADEAGGGSCGKEYAACHADPKCLSLFQCGIPRGCFQSADNLIPCLTACGIAAGLTGIDDPAVAPFLGLYTCATASCASACAGPQDLSGNGE